MTKLAELEFHPAGNVINFIKNNFSKTAYSVLKKNLTFLPTRNY